MIERTETDVDFFNLDMRNIAHDRVRYERPETQGEYIRRNADEMGEIMARTMGISDSAQRAYMQGVLYGFGLRMVEHFKGQK